MPASPSGVRAFRVYRQVATNRMTPPRPVVRTGAGMSAGDIYVTAGVHPSRHGAVPKGLATGGEVPGVGLPRGICWSSYCNCGAGYPPSAGTSPSGTHVRLWLRPAALNRALHRVSVRVAWVSGGRSFPSPRAASASLASASPTPCVAASNWARCPDATGKAPWRPSSLPQPGAGGAGSTSFSSVRRTALAGSPVFADAACGASSLVHCGRELTGSARGVFATPTRVQIS